MRYIRTDVRGAWVLISALLLPGAALAQEPGDLDPSFGNAGQVLTSIGADNDEVGDAAVQPDGKIIVAGHAWAAGSLYFTVVRYLPDGDLDPTFDGDGVVITSFGTTAVTQAAAVQPDGKIVVGGYTVDPNTSQSSFALARYLPDGSLDTTFSGDGLVTTATNAQVYEVLLQTDGRIVAVGSSTLARYLADGTLDPTFGNGGLVSVESAEYRAGALQADGKIVVAGQTFNTSTFQDEFAIARYLPDGTLDPTFGSGGRVITDVSDGSARAVIVQPDGKIVAAGRSYGGASGHLDFTLVRYLPDGALDLTFGGDGLVTTDFGDLSQAFDLLLQPDGKIVAGGYAFLVFALARYLPDGTLDQTFSDDGMVVTNFGPNDSSAVQALLVQPHNGRLVAAGSSTRTGEGGFDFALAGYISGLVPGKGPPTHKDECKHGGWREFTIPRAFINQGDCIKFVKTGH